jgi:7,8-dihydropterin-6-yl-methyl-4-(beta-D-ribofuranosyl)aminobenzene 5'-phosphate synthase
MSENKTPFTRRDFIKGAALGLGLGAIGAMGLYSYSPMSRKHIAQVQRKQGDFGVCRGVKCRVISETSWFDNSQLMGDIKAAGGLLVDQYTYNWPPFGDGTGLGERGAQRQLASAGIELRPLRGPDFPRRVTLLHHPAPRTVHVTYRYQYIIICKHA